MDLSFIYDRFSMPRLVTSTGCTAVDRELTRTWNKIEIERKEKLRDFSPQANYTDRATAACRRN
jgi:hypothetical protein